jgi:macrolide-specific efflux system membrane fusion protein
MVQVLDAKGMPQPREIETGISDAANIQVRRGLQEGEQVILGSAPAEADAVQGDPLLGF